MERSPKNIGWFAGLVEGEGYVGWHGSKPNQLSPEITIAMTDPDVLEKARKLIGGGLYGPYFYKDYLPTYRLSLFGKPAIGWMMTIYPLLGARRQTQVLSLIEEWKASPYGTYSSRGKACASKSWTTRYKKYGPRGRR